MTIINPNSELITINYFNRIGNDPTTVTFYNESTRINTTLEVDNFINGSYFDILTLDNTGFLNENEDFVISIKDNSGNILFLDKAFTTSQSNYSINNNIYTTNPTDTEYLIYE